MLCLKEINYEDIDEEYLANTKMPFYENGVENPYYDVTKEEYKEEVIPTLINNGKGIGIKEGDVASTYYFLWNDNHIVGNFKLRHYLNKTLKIGAGHVGYYILEEYRNNHNATEGLGLLVEKSKDIVIEDELYLSAFNYNVASIKVMLKNGAYIVKKDSRITYARIKIR